MTWNMAPTSLEMHKDAIGKGRRVLIVDDLLGDRRNGRRGHAW